MADPLDRHAQQPGASLEQHYEHDADHDDRNTHQVGRWRPTRLVIWEQRGGNAADVSARHTKISYLLTSIRRTIAYSPDICKAEGSRRSFEEASGEGPPRPRLRRCRAQESLEIEPADTMPAMTTEHSIRPASDDDLDQVLAWLESEYERDGEGFWCNRNVIRDCQGERKMIVISEEPSGSPLGFLLGHPRDTNIPIVDIRKEHQRHGLGRTLVEHHVEDAVAEQLPGMIVQRKPETSKAFWTAMGFEELPEGPFVPPSRRYYTAEHAIRLLDVPLGVDPDEARVQIDASISLGDGTPVRSYALDARRSSERPSLLKLERRFVVFSANPDLYVEYRIDGQPVFERQKLKYEESQLECCEPFWSLDILDLPESPGL